MTIAIVGSVATTPFDYRTSAQGQDINLPAGIQAGELLVIHGMFNVSNALISGWTREGGEYGTTGLDGWLFWKVATGSEGSTVHCTFGTSGNVGAVAWRMTGVDTDAPVTQYVAGANATENPFALAAATMADIVSGNWCLLGFGAANANRTVVTPDGDVTNIVNMTAGVVGGNLNVYYEEPTNGDNSAYSFTMSDTRDWRWALFEIKAAAAASNKGRLLMLGVG